MPSDTTAFPADFVWGAATAAYQIEGAARADGRGESVWDRFAATPGKVRGGDTGEIACDFYHRYPEDIALMRELGLDAFRFSVSWPRVFPQGRGPLNQVGLDFYDRLVDELLAAGIEPFPTLFHWDTPQALEEAGGWPLRATAEAFFEFAEVVVARLGDRVRHWTTQNEPGVVSSHGYGFGVHAPGRTSPADAVAAAHHLLLSHGWAVDAIRRLVPDASVGLAFDLAQPYPASDSPEDLAAAWRIDGECNRWFLDPVFRAAYPDDQQERIALVERVIRDGDLAAIAAPVDFIGVNTYRRHVVAAGNGRPRILRPEGQYTTMDWEVYPDGLHRLLVRLADDYGPAAIYVTENGAAYGDVRGHDGEVHDLERAAYIRDHLDAVGRAIADGVPVKGYFVWSLLDNFEWGYGYSQRFGLVYVDFPTLERVPKDSFRAYRGFIAGHRPSPEPATGLAESRQAAAAAARGSMS
jgi:beta-glucosidase